MDKYDVIVIGGGPGGYPAAIRAAQEGASVALVEGDRLGGECTNYGCIPTKAMLKPLEALYMLKGYSFMKAEVSIDFKEYMEWVSSIVSRVSSGVEMLLKGYGVEVIRSRGVLRGGGTVSTTDGELRARRLVLALGTSPASLPGIRVDGDTVHDNRTILGLRRKPASILIIGGGYIGVEYANIMAKHGVEVFLVEMLPRLLPGMDEDFSRIVTRRLKRRGVKVYTETKVEEVTVGEGGVKARLSRSGVIEAEKVLVAVGRRPNTRDVGLEREGVKLDDKGYIVVDEEMKTVNPRIYASGDVTGPPLLAHKAFLQGIVAGTNAAGGSIVYEPRAIPSVVYTDPELASVGMTLEEARSRGLDAVEKKYPLGGLAMANILGSTDGFVKLVIDNDSGSLLGVHIAAPHAGEIIAELALALEFGGTVEDLALTIHPHPSISEAVKEAAELALGRPIHYLLRRR